MKVYRVCFDPHRPSEWFEGKTFKSFKGESVVFVTHSLDAAIGVAIAYEIDGYVWEYEVDRAFAIDKLLDPEVIEYREKLDNVPAPFGMNDIPINEGIIYLNEAKEVKRVF